MSDGTFSQSKIDELLSKIHNDSDPHEVGKKEILEEFNKEPTIENLFHIIRSGYNGRYIFHHYFDFQECLDKVTEFIKLKFNYKYFQNKGCECFPCHRNIGNDDKDFSCIFCYCPLYRFINCGGKYVWIGSKDNKRIKDCSSCTFPHNKNNYELILNKIKQFEGQYIE